MHYSPKLVTSAKAKQRADLYLVVRDLEQVAACADRLSKNGDIIRPTPENQALLDSAIIRYGRCFNDGHRTKIGKLLDQVSKEERSLHDYVLAVRNKHNAHSENELEMAGTTFHVAVGPDGTLERGGLGVSGHFIAELSTSEVKALEGLAQKLRALTNDWIKKLDASILRDLQGITDVEILALPEGFAPTIAGKPQVAQARTWPMKHTKSRA
jgi:hypothetical protein